MITRRWPVAVIGVMAVLASLVPASVSMAGTRATAPRPAARMTRSSAQDRVNDPDRVLGEGWRSSPDRAVATDGDASGFHVLVADEASGYAWRTAATLSEPGTDTDHWIGQACVTGSGTEAVVVYAPRQLTNDPNLIWQGALAAVVNLDTGAVRKLAQPVSMAYYDPGCGAGETVTLSSQTGGDATGKAAPISTKLMTVDTARGRIGSTLTVRGQVTSAVPYRDGVVAADGDRLVSIDSHGAVRTLATTHGVPFRLAVDTSGGVAYQVPVGRQTQIRRFDGAQDTLVGTTGLGSIRVQPGGAGGAALVGPRASSFAGGRLPGGWLAVDAAATAQVSTRGALAVSEASNQIKDAGALSPAPDVSLPIHITATVTRTHATASFDVRPAEASVAARAPSPAVAGLPSGGGKPKLSPKVDASTMTTDPDRTCSVPRNDPQHQTYQPNPAQEEWAADLAVTGSLTGTRGPNLYQSGLPAYSPQGMFPPPGLQGGGQVPPQILLSVLAQESAEYQASDHVIDGQTGNFMPSSNWYGDDGNFTYVNFPNADCGYGAAQVTTGMCLASACPSGDTAFPANDQMAVAIDYQANIAAGLQILEQKWNQLYQAGMLVNGGDPKYLENWWLALWAYNSGFHTQGSDPSGMWGVGWVNNPINPNYPADREMFLSGDYNDDVKNPGDWSYEEKVIGFAGYGLYRYNFVDKLTELAFQKAGWPSNEPPQGEPGHGIFCTTSNQCSPTDTSSPCQRGDSECWWHLPISWVNCASWCGTGVPKYAAGSATPAAPVPSGYPPQCTTGLASNAVIVDDLPSSIPAALGCPGENYTSQGSLTWRFGLATSLTFPSKIDFHQIGAGLGGHFWFAHSQPASSPTLAVTGTWHPPTSVKGWTRILVHIPNYGAWDPQSDYTVNLGNGTSQHRTLNQAWQTNTWVDLGSFDLASGATVSLSNTTAEGLDRDIAWDALAFVPTSQPTTDYVAMGDSYSAGEGLQPYDPNTDYSYNGTTNSCHRSTTQAYPRLVTLKGHSAPVAQEAQTLTGGTNFTFIACSGAETVGVTASSVDTSSSATYTDDQHGNTEWGAVSYDGHEMLQAGQGALNAGTTLVTLTLGGDDARFSDVLTGCLLPGPFADCTDSGYVLTRHSNGAVDPGPLATFEPNTVIAQTYYHLIDAYTAVHAAAPNARIIVLGYPRLFPASPGAGGCIVGLGFNLSQASQIWLDKMGTALNQQIQSAVGVIAGRGVNIQYVDPNPGFETHRLCDSGAPYVNGLINWSSSGSGFQIIGAGSFHPEAAGQKELAYYVNCTLAATCPQIAARRPQIGTPK